VVEEVVKKVSREGIIRNAQVLEVLEVLEEKSKKPANFKEPDVQADRDILQL
jgi:hypothetical protein